MRKNKRDSLQSGFSILTIDDDPIMTETLQAYFHRDGYDVDIENNPLEAIDTVRNGHYDIIMLDYVMNPINGDEVVERIREFNKEIYIILLTGHRDIVPPLKTVRTLDIQGYFEKSDRFDQLEMLVESCVKSIKQMRIINRYREGMTNLSEQMPEVSKLNRPDDICAKICELEKDLWDSTAFMCAIADSKLPNKCFMVKSGEFSDIPEDIPVSGIPENISPAINKAQMLSAFLTDTKGKRIGYVAIVLDDTPDEFERRRFDIFARECSAVIENSLLLERVNNNRFELIKALRLLVESHDELNPGHSERVSNFAAKIAKKAGMDDETVERVRTAGFLHDIGKTAIPDSILLSQRALSDEEQEDIRNHTTEGSTILSKIPVLASFAPIVAAHHERPDGHGYPNGLKGDQIPFEAKIIAIADTYDAMSSWRQYSSGMSILDAIDKLSRLRGTQLDAEYTDIFINLLKSEGDGREEKIAFYGFRNNI